MSFRLVALCLLLSSSASADVYVIGADGGTPQLTIDSVDVELRCSAINVCSYEERIVYANATDSPVAAVALRYRHHARPSVTFTVDGAAAPSDLPDAARTAADELQHNAPDAGDAHDAVRFTVPAHGRTTVACSGELEMAVLPRALRDWHPPDYALVLLPTQTARHVIVNPDPQVFPTTYDGWLDMHGETKLGPVPPMRVHVTAPAGTYIAQINPDGPTSEVHLRLEAGSVPVQDGGPVVGLGSVMSQGKGHASVRAGWEVLLHTWLGSGQSELMAAVVSDLTFKSSVELTFTPLVEVSTPFLLIFPIIPVPGFGMAVGAPVRVTPDLAVGMRGELTVALPILGVVGYVEYFPHLHDHQFGVMVRLSL